MWNPQRCNHENTEGSFFLQNLEFCIKLFCIFIIGNIVIPINISKKFNKNSKKRVPIFDTDLIKEKSVAHVGDAKKSIEIAMAWFTDSDLERAYKC